MLIEREMRKVPFGGAWAWGALRMPGWLSCIGIEKHGQPGDGAFIEFPFAAHVTDPGREVRNHDQFFSQPGKVGNVPQMHHASGTLIALE